jgi:ComF family protein
MFAPYIRGMNVIEYGISLLAPHLCIVCKREGPPVCLDCAKQEFTALSPFCYRCQSATSDVLPCAACAVTAPLDRIWISTGYHGPAKETVAALKFNRMKAAAPVMASWLDLRLPSLEESVIVSPVPTANSRVRMRGYDQASLIARQFARRRGLAYRETLHRISNTRQVGAGRRDRFNQLEGAFRVRRPATLTGSTILLVDDVLTTGATLETAAKILKSHGVKTVNAAVFAH